MKKTILLLSISCAVMTANAQSGITLTGTSHTENFDAQSKTQYLSQTCPGWHVYYNATAASLGIYDDSGSTSTYNYNDSYPGADPVYGAFFDTVDCKIKVFSHGFKNSASADGIATLTGSDTLCSTQLANSNRSLSVRQSSATSHPGFDPGPAFCFHLNNTNGQENFTATFNLQSLDPRCSRTTTWEIDYGFGLNPTVFTPVPSASITGTLTTGNYTYANNAITVNFGSALNNMSSDVWIRIATIAATTDITGGNGFRTTTGIDDFNLNWVLHPASVTNVSTQPGLDLTVLGTATPDNISMKYNVEEAGNYSLTINDITGRVLHTEAINATNGGQVIAINGLHLAPGMYIATMQNANSKAIARVSVQ